MISVRIFFGIRYSVHTKQSDVFCKTSCVFASNHQSTWDIAIFPILIPRSVYVIKKELLRLPVFGWYLWRTGCIPINRNDKKHALRILLKKAKKALDQGLNIIVFPQGTRVAFGEKRPYKGGVVFLHDILKVDVVPVALGSGYCWPNKGWRLYSGEILVSFLHPIDKNVDKKEFLHMLESSIEKERYKIEKKMSS